MSNSQNGARAVTDHIFTNLLASAYSLQQRQDRLKSRVPASKSNELMSAVLETQGLVWHHSVHPDTAMQLIASRSQKLCGAAGELVHATINQIEAAQFLPHSGIRFPQNPCSTCPYVGLCLGKPQLVEAALVRRPGAQDFGVFDELTY
jgi:hypothetical protein